jgi:hypothetical protein
MKFKTSVLTFTLPITIPMRWENVPHLWRLGFMPCVDCGRVFRPRLREPIDLAKPWLCDRCFEEMNGRSETYFVKLSREGARKG